MIYKVKKHSLKQAYILSITCSLSRAVHLEFIRAFKRFVATRGRLERIYSDHAKTIKAAATWIKSIRKSKEETSNLEEDINMIEGDLRKRAKYVKKCKDNTWNSWKGEYLKSLRERYNMRCRKENRPALAIGDLVIIEGEERNRNL